MKEKTGKSFSTAVFTLWLIRFFALLFAVCLFAAPFAAKKYVSYSERPDSYCTVLLVTFYVCSPAAAVVLHNTARLLKNIINGSVFESDTIKRIEILGKACLAVVPLSIPMCFWFLGGIPIPSAALLMGLLLAVIREVFSSGRKIREENDMTI